MKDPRFIELTELRDFILAQPDDKPIRFYEYSNKWHDGTPCIGCLLVHFAAKRLRWDDVSADFRCVSGTTRNFNRRGRSIVGLRKVHDLFKKNELPDSENGHMSYGILKKKLKPLSQLPKE